MHDCRPYIARPVSSPVIPRSSAYSAGVLTRDSRGSPDPLLRRAVAARSTGRPDWLIPLGGTRPGRPGPGRVAGVSRRRTGRSSSTSTGQLACRRSLLKRRRAANPAAKWPRHVDGGRWTVDGGQWTADGGRWTVDGGR